MTTTVQQQMQLYCCRHSDMAKEVKAHTTESPSQLTKTQSCSGYPHVSEWLFMHVHVHVHGVETVPQYAT